MSEAKHKEFILRAVELAREGVASGRGGPFGCVIVRDGQVIGEGCNRVLKENDPTAHAEIVAIRAACQYLKTFQLTGCTIYASCEPCPMCLGAIYWARPELVVYANTRKDAASIGFDDVFIYEEINKEMVERSISFLHEPEPLALQQFHEWAAMEKKNLY